MSVAEAQQRIAFGLPIWIPEGFRLHEDVAVLESEKSLVAYVRWENAEGVLFSLRAEQPLSPDTIEAPLDVAEGSVEEVQVNGQPAALVRGAWNGDSRVWGHSRIRTLQWAHEGIRYSLSAGLDVMTEQDMLRLAESLQ
jgi:hypothetical protein